MITKWEEGEESSGGAYYSSSNLPSLRVKSEALKEKTTVRSRVVKPILEKEERCDPKDLFGSCCSSFLACNFLHAGD